LDFFLSAVCVWPGVLVCCSPSLVCRSPCLVCVCAQTVSAFGCTPGVCSQGYEGMIVGVLCFHGKQLNTPQAQHTTGSVTSPQPMSSTAGPTKHMSHSVGPSPISLRHLFVVTTIHPFSVSQCESHHACIMIRCTCIEDSGSQYLGNMHTCHTQLPRPARMSMMPAGSQYIFMITILIIINRHHHQHHHHHHLGPVLAPSPIRSCHQACCPPSPTPLHTELGSAGQVILA